MSLTLKVMAMTCAVLLIAACGETTPTPAAGDEPLPAPTVPETFEAPPTTVQSSTTVRPTTMVPVTTEAPPTTEPAIDPETLSIRTTDLVATITLPDTIEDSPFSPPPLPDFVVQYEAWVVPDCCRLNIVVESIIPLYPEEQLIERIESDGAVWDIYDLGPSDGTQVAAVAASGDTGMIVGTQSLSEDSTTKPSPLEIVKTIASAAIVESP